MHNYHCVGSGFSSTSWLPPSVHVTPGMTSGPSQKGPTMNRVSSMLVVSSPLPAMDVLPGKAQHRRNKDRKQTLLTCGLKQQTNKQTKKLQNPGGLQTP